MIYKTMACVVIAGLLLTGCDDKKTETAKNESTPSTQATAQSQSTLEQETSLKAQKGNLWLRILDGDFMGLNTTPLGNIAYASSFADVDSEAERLLKKYSNEQGKVDLSNIRKSKGVIEPTFLMTGIRGTATESVNDYKKVIEKLKALTPSMPELDNAGEAFSQRYIELSQALAAINDYYKVSEEYKLDDFAKSATLHDNLFAAYKNYLAAREQFDIAYSKLYTELHQMQKQNLKLQGLNIVYDVYDSLDVAQEMLDDLIAYFDKNSSLSGYDKDSLQKKITQLETIISQLKPLENDQQAVSKEGLRYNDFKSYLNSWPKFITQSKVVLRDLEDKNAGNELQTLYTQFQYIIPKYNDTISR